jgi:hypothetical protein
LTVNSVRLEGSIANWWTKESIFFCNKRTWHVNDADCCPITLRKTFTSEQKRVSTWWSWRRWNFKLSTSSRIIPWCFPMSGMTANTMARLTSVEETCPWSRTHRCTSSEVCECPFELLGVNFSPINDAYRHLITNVNITTKSNGMNKLFTRHPRPMQEHKTWV